MNSSRHLITLTTDFGYNDPYVGIMKGVILRIAPEVQIVDLNHGITPQDIRAAALSLAASVDSFPDGTVHVVVVDPGVGSERRAIVIESASHYFVGPDNGVLSLALKGKEPARILDLSNETYHLQPKSGTFHGRDVFAPVAAHLARGVPLDDFGASLEDCVRLRWPRVDHAGDSILGEISYIDRFGNLFTNIGESDLMSLSAGRIRLRLGEIDILGLSPNYAAGQGNRLIALINSWGLVEIAIFKGNAASQTGAQLGDKVRVDLVA